MSLILDHTDIKQILDRCLKITMHVWWPFSLSSQIKQTNKQCLKTYTLFIICQNINLTILSEILLHTWSWFNYLNKNRPILAHFLGFCIMKTKVVERFERFQETQNKQIQKVTALYLMWNSEICQDVPKRGQDDLILLMFLFSSRKISG